MTEIVDNLWKYHSLHHWVVITTNGFVKANGCAVMGRGTALQATTKYSTFPRELGTKLLESGNNVHSFPDKRIFTYPVKHKWWEQADLDLIETSARQLVDAVNQSKVGTVYMPRPGCGFGGLTWAKVFPRIRHILDTRFVVVHLHV